VKAYRVKIVVVKEVEAWADNAQQALMDVVSLVETTKGSHVIAGQSVGHEDVAFLDQKIEYAPDPRYN
jgi:hypothetical protein